MRAKWSVPIWVERRRSLAKGQHRRAAQEVGLARREPLPRLARLVPHRTCRSSSLGPARPRPARKAVLRRGPHMLSFCPDGTKGASSPVMTARVNGDVAADQNGPSKTLDLSVYASSERAHPRTGPLTVLSRRPAYRREPPRRPSRWRLPLRPPATRPQAGRQGRLRPRPGGTEAAVAPHPPLGVEQPGGNPRPAARPGPGPPDRAGAMPWPTWRAWTAGSARLSQEPTWSPPYSRSGPPSRSTVSSAGPCTSTTRSLPRAATITNGGSGFRSEVGQPRPDAGQQICAPCRGQA